MQRRTAQEQLEGRDRGHDRHAQDVGASDRFSLARAQHREYLVKAAGECGAILTDKRTPLLVRAKLDDLLARTKRILEQRTKDKNKLYAMHASTHASIMDKGYQGVGAPGIRILRSGQRRGVTKGLKA